MKNFGSGLILFLICTSFALSSFGQLSDIKDKKTVADFVELIQTEQVGKLADQVKYPLRRVYPIPAVYNKCEFIQRYTEIFDDSLKNIITHSDPINDWSKVGWRGIMLLQGLLWIDGKLTSVNHQSVSEKRLSDLLIAKDKSRLPANLRNYRKPILYMETQKFIIRIDEMEGNKYRYASWSRGSNTVSTPDLVLLNGTWTPDGSGGNHYYRFLSGDYQYDCIIALLNNNGIPSATIEVSKAGQKVLKQTSTLLKI
ncbi:MAG: hypothetical protein WKF66_06015 [Pedobacter sp.]